MGGMADLATITITISAADDTEWRGVLEALGQYVENEQCNDEYEDSCEENPNLAGAEAVLERMDIALLTTLGIG